LITRPALLLAVAVGVAACAGGGGGGGGTSGGGGGGCKCDPPGCPTVSFNGNIQPIFTRSCATSSQCHGPNGAQNLDLTAGVSIRNTVGVKSTQQPKKLLVKAGNAADSYLFQKITNAPGISGIMMPQGCPGNPIGGAVCLSDAETSAIEEWITECATATPSLP
jgi:hypothetical protein